MLRVKAPLPGIHTSDRLLFKRCRRKWNWQSPLREYLEPLENDFPALWFGTGYHFAMEDYHGYKDYLTPENAFFAYCFATQDQRPDEWLDLAPVAQSMLSYYREYWLPRRDIYQTYQLDGVPQVEVSWEIKIPHRKALYVGRFDRVVTDPYGRLWVEDYKTAKKIDSKKLETDPQVTSYALVASQLYGIQFEGIVYTQFLKEIPRWPKRLISGKFSQDKSQHVTYDTYTSALLQEFGSVPPEYSDFLGFLAASETEDGDLFIRRETVSRSQAAQQAELQKIIAEAGEMLSSKTILYPNPTNQCSWDCAFRTPCLQLDDQADWQSTIDTEYHKRTEGLEPWRQHLLPLSDVQYQISQLPILQ